MGKIGVNDEILIRNMIKVGSENIYITFCLNNDLGVDFIRRTYKQ